jgi:hypothetical protein
VFTGPESLGAGGARNTEKSDLSSWPYAMGWARRELAGRDIRSQRIKEHRGVSSRVERTTVLGSAASVELKKGTRSSKPRDSALTEGADGDRPGSLH